MPRGQCSPGTTDRCAYEHRAIVTLTYIKPAHCPGRQNPAQKGERRHEILPFAAEDLWVSDSC